MIRDKSNYVTSVEAASILGFTPDHIRKLIGQKKLKAEKLGRNWIIAKQNLKLVKRLRFPRPKDSQ